MISQTPSEALGIRRAGDIYDKLVAKRIALVLR